MTPAQLDRRLRAIDNEQVRLLHDEVQASRRRILAQQAEEARQALEPRPTPTDRRRAPWPDFRGMAIYHGDEIVHPATGERGTVVYCPRMKSELDTDRWQVIYETAIVSRLCLQLGDKGQAVVVRRKL